MTTYAILTAAGAGSRFGADVPKALVLLGGEPLVVHAARRLLDSGAVEHLVVTAPGSALEAVRAALAQAGLPAAVVPGGASRQESVALGLAAVPDDADVVLVHDAARALAPLTLVARVVAAVRAGRAGVVPTLPVADTMKRVAVREGGEAMLGPGVELVAETVPRADLRVVQTPQGFDAQVLRAAHAKHRDRGRDETVAATDDAALLEAEGVQVWSVLGDELATKITTPSDLVRAELLLRGSQGATDGGAADGGAADGVAADDDDIDGGGASDWRTGLPRTGVGVDVHALAPEGQERELWLAGLLWPGERGLAGHSDADPVAHAAADALFSASGLGDLGSNFGTSEPEWAGAPGSTLLAEAARRVRAAGFEIGNVAVQIVGNRPRLGPRRAEAEAAMSAAAGAPVTVSATTSDHLGFTGRGEGVAAMATALVVRTDRARARRSGR
ncbi:MAG: 2-C-methyl-D-erythritol 4-phosphate cytidylyltransferase [Cellulomonadaceae bacterium]